MPEPGIMNLKQTDVPHASQITSLEISDTVTIKTLYTITAISRDLRHAAFPLFPYAVSGYSREGIHITALIEATTPEAAAEHLGAVFEIVGVLSIAEGMVNVNDEWKWLGFLPAPEPRPRGLLSLFRFWRR